jgi:hypothetical protein
MALDAVSSSVTALITLGAVFIIETVIAVLLNRTRTPVQKLEKECEIARASLESLSKDAVTERSQTEAHIKCLERDVATLKANPPPPTPNMAVMVLNLGGNFAISSIFRARGTRVVFQFPPGVIGPGMIARFLSIGAKDVPPGSVSVMFFSLVVRTTIRKQIRKLIPPANPPTKRPSFATQFAQVKAQAELAAQAR